MKVLLHISLAALMLFASCTQDATPNEIDAINQADKDFAYKAGQLYIANMELSEMAYHNTTDTSIMMLAEKILVTSRNAYNDLNTIGRAKGAVVAGGMDEAHTGFKNGLSGLSGWAFDSAYVHNALQDQHHLLAENNLLQQNGNNLTLRSHGKYFSDTFQVYHDIVDSLADNY